MNLTKRIAAFAELGHQLSKIVDPNAPIQSKKALKIRTLIEELVYYNAWFTPENVRFCLLNWSQALSQENLERWLNCYIFPENSPEKNVGLILAGNIPMVGFHDILCVLLSDHRFTAKCSSTDHQLIPSVMELLCEIEPHFSEKITFTESLMKHVDAFIATGNDNSARYFDFYFQKYPHLIRRNRNAVAILNGNETIMQLKALSNDVFQYFGMGCRNVSKIFIPKNYCFDQLIEAFSEWKYIENHHKYKNNYDYNLAVALLNNDVFLDSGFFLLKPSQGISSPISVIFYEIYDTLDQVFDKISNTQEQIQCIVSQIEKKFIPFGTAQLPQLWDYADGADTLKFLTT